MEKSKTKVKLLIISFITLCFTSILGVEKSDAPQYIGKEVYVTCYCIKGITASGSRTDYNIIAVSRDLEKFFKRGDEVYVSYNGKLFKRKIGDRMHRRIRNTVDIWHSSCKWCIEFGRRKGSIWKRK